MSDTKVLVLVGSLRAASVNRQLAELAVGQRAGGRHAVTLFDRLGDLPFYNEDIDNEDVAELGRRAARRPPPTPTPRWSSPRSTTAASPAC